MSRSINYMLRMAESERDKWQQAAERDGLTLAEYIRQAVEARIVGNEVRELRKRLAAIRKLADT